MSVKPLGRVRRLTDAAVFQSLLRKGRRYTHGVITARVLDAAAVGRLGLSIAKRHLKKASDRNKLKRIIREAYRLRGDATEGMDVLFMLADGGKIREELKRVPATLKTADGRRNLRSSIEEVLALVVAAGQARQISQKGA
jgi:ribonuclease P protein component